MKAPNSLFGIAGWAVVLALATAGCATKRYVRETVAPVDQRVTEVESKSTAAVAELGEKTQKDISRVEERAMTADGKATDAGRAAKQADDKAAQAGQTAQDAQKVGQQNLTKIGEVHRTVENIENYKVVSTEELLFAFNRSTLSDEAKATLDRVVQRVAGVNRPLLEIEGSADTIGSTEYNFVLSRQRADAVVRYLLGKGIPLRRVHLIGLGEPDVEGRVTSADREKMRRVVVRVMAP